MCVPTGMVSAPEGTRGAESERRGVEEREILPSRAAQWRQRGAPPRQPQGTAAKPFFPLAFSHFSEVEVVLVG